MAPKELRLGGTLASATPLLSRIRPLSPLVCVFFCLEPSQSANDPCVPLVSSYFLYFFALFFRIGLVCFVLLCSFSFVRFLLFVFFCSFCSFCFVRLLCSFCFLCVVTAAATTARLCT